jgi:hypothetical protein
MFKAGAAEVCITPPIGVELAGYGPRLQRYSTDIHDHLMGQALVLDDGETRVAIVTCDLISLSAAFVREVRQLVHKRTGIPPAHVMLACIHSHTAPTTQAFHDWASRIAVTCIWSPAIWPGRSWPPASSCNRRVSAWGAIRTRPWPGTAPGAWSPIRPWKSCTWRALRASRWRCWRITPAMRSFWGRNRHFRRLSRRAAPPPGAARPGGVILFANGACGDVDPATNREVWGQGTFADVDAAGAGLAAAAWEAVERGAPISSTRIGVRQGPLEMAYAVPSLAEVRGQIAHYQAEARALGNRPERFEEVTGEVQMPRFWLGYYRRLEKRLLAHDLPAEAQVELQAFCLGDQAVLLAVPAEVYTAQGKHIRRESPSSTRCWCVTPTAWSATSPPPRSSPRGAMRPDWRRPSTAARRSSRTSPPG